MSAAPGAGAAVRARALAGGRDHRGRAAGDGWSAVDWLAFFDERAGIAEFDGGLPRAEAQAFTCCVVEWLNRNPERSSPGYCLSCGDRAHADDPLLRTVVKALTRARTGAFFQSEKRWQE
jgi:hypothetical protein